MEKKKELACPFLTTKFIDTHFNCACLEDKCAWWSWKGDRCGIAVLANAHAELTEILDHYIARRSYER